jgi:hypothetical protein
VLGGYALASSDSVSPSARARLADDVLLLVYLVNAASRRDDHDAMPMPRKMPEVLTPIHRFRQLEPSWLRSGQTTSLFESVMENEAVSD